MRNGLTRLAQRGGPTDRFVLGIWLVLIFGAWFVFELVRPPFITVEDVTVDRFVRGNDPHVVYALTVHHKRRARWSAEIVGTQCKGSGVHTYEPGSRAHDWRLFADYLELDSATISARCDLPAGAYAMLTCYEWFLGLRRHCGAPVPILARDRIPPA